MECKQKDLLAQSPLKAMFKVCPLNVEVWVLGGCVTAEHLEHCHGKNCRSSGPGSLIIKRTHSAGLGWVGISYCDGDTGLPSAYTHQYCHEYQEDIQHQNTEAASCSATLLNDLVVSSLNFTTGTEFDEACFILTVSINRAVNEISRKALNGRLNTVSSPKNGL